MVERLIIVLAMAACIVAAVTIARAVAQSRLRGLQTGDVQPLWTALGAEPDGRPTVVAFSTPSCVACRTAQAPALRALEQELSGGVRVLKVNAADQPDVATVFGVLTVPTTVVLSPNGQVAAANNGFAPSNRLIEQVRAAGVA